VPLYLDPDRVELLNHMVKKTGLTKQDLLRLALDSLLRKHNLLKRRRRTSKKRDSSLADKRANIRAGVVPSGRRSV
jgi:hypothetical protein